MAAKSGNLELLKVIHASGLNFTPATMDLGLCSGNRALIRYMIRNTHKIQRGPRFLLETAKALYEQGPDIITLLQSSDKAANMYRLEIQSADIFTAAVSGDSTRLEIALEALQCSPTDILSPRPEVYGYALVLSLPARRFDAVFTLFDYTSIATVQDSDGRVALQRALESKDKTLVSALLRALPSPLFLGRAGRHLSGPDPVQLALGLNVPWITQRVIEECSPEANESYIDASSLRDLLEEKEMWKDMFTIKRLIQHAEMCSDSRASTILSSVMLLSGKHGEFEAIHRIFAWENAYNLSLPVLETFHGDVHLLSTFAIAQDRRSALGRSARALFINLLIKERELEKLQQFLQFVKGEPGFREILSDGDCVYESGTFARTFSRFKGSASPLSTAMSSDHPDGLEATRMLLELGADPNDITSTLRPPYGFEASRPVRRTALLQAIDDRNERLVSLLITHGARVNCLLSEQTGYSPLQKAAESGDIAITQLLLGNGARSNDPPTVWRGLTALEHAAREGYAGIVELLMEYGAEPNPLGGQLRGRSTALELAAKHGRFDAVKFLLKKGAEPTLRRPSGEYREIQSAEEEGHLEIAGLLRAHAPKSHALCVDEQPLEHFPIGPSVHSLMESFELTSDSDSGHTKGPEEGHEAHRVTTVAKRLPKGSFTCAQCEGSFVNASSLKRHTRTRHGSITTHQCRLCDFSCPRSDTLGRHIRTKHTGTGKMVCKGCGGEFREDWLQIHLKTRPEWRMAVHGNAGSATGGGSTGSWSIC